MAKPTMIQVSIPAEEIIEECLKKIKEEMDVVEVVRCKDCKWFNDYGCAIRIVDESDKPKEMDFCSFGERREDAEVH